MERRRLAGIERSGFNLLAHNSLAEAGIAVRIVLATRTLAGFYSLPAALTDDPPRILAPRRL
jgi:hypothetical protein